MNNQQIEELLTTLLKEVRETKSMMAESGSVNDRKNDCRLSFDFTKIKKCEVMMIFVDLYERFAIFGTKDNLQRFLSEQTNLGTRQSVDRLYNRCLHDHLRK